MQASDFTNLHDMTKVRGFYVDNRLGHLEQTLAVANSPKGGTYPVGTILQLVPQEAMVKRRKGFDPATKDWEFFFLDDRATGTKIVTRGADDVVNRFGGNCAACHSRGRRPSSTWCASTTTAARRCRSATTSSTGSRKPTRGRGTPPPVRPRRDDRRRLPDPPSGDRRVAGRDAHGGAEIRYIDVISLTATSPSPISPVAAPPTIAPTALLHLVVLDEQRDQQLVRDQHLVGCCRGTRRCVPASGRARGRR